MIVHRTERKGDQPMTHQDLLPIPQPPEKPFLGNLLEFDRVSPVQGLVKLANRYGPIFQLKVRGRRLIVVSGFTLVDELCDQSRFDKTVDGALQKVRAFTGNGLFTAHTNDPDWSKAHNILLPNFSHRAMESYHAMMLDVASQLAAKWDRLNSEDEIDVAHDMTSLTLDTIGICGFDYRFNSFYRETNHPFVRAMVNALSTAMAQLRRLPLEGLLRKGQDRDFANDIKFMNQMVDRIVQDRREGIEREGDAKAKADLLNSMLEGVDRKTGERLDDLNIRYQIITFLIAGHETTSGMLSFAINAMVNSRDVLERAYAEVDRVLGPDPSILPSSAQVNQFNYITQILKESLRLWPTAPAFSVHPYEDTVVGGKYAITKADQLLVLLPALHRDKAIWGEQAEKFDPDNFSPEAERKRPANAWKPFGNGQRACIGRQFAMHEAALVLGMVLHRFRLIDHTRYKLTIKETLTMKPDGFRIKVKRRTDHPTASVGTASANPLAGISHQNGPSNGLPDDYQNGVAAHPAVPRHGTPLLVLYGSNLGTAEEVAGRIAQDGEAYGFAVKLAPLDDYAGKLPTEGAVIVTTASYNGTPPDNAAKFCEWVTGPELVPDALKGVKYTVFGCGNRDWTATFQAIPRLIDAQLEKHGAQRVSPRGEGDARDDFDGQFQAWYQPLWTTIAAAIQIDLKLDDGTARTPLYTVETVQANDADNPIAESLGARPMRLTLRRELHTKDGPNPSERSTRHLEFEIPEGVSYRAGDHLGVVPHNSDELVRRVARRFGFEGDVIVRLRKTASRKTALPIDQPVAVFTLLRDYLELQEAATRSQIETLAAFTECPPEKARLKALVADEAYRSEVLAKRVAVIDLLEQAPACALPFGVFLEMMPPLAPRYYSISSSPLADPRRLSLTIAVVEGSARSGRGIYRGVCSNYLASLKEGDSVRAFVRDNGSGFRPPADPSVPMIMIGPGTGIAPFRGFLQERSALKASGQKVGPSMLFFGCRRPDQDFIYADELHRFAEEGITELVCTFSRIDPQRKIYVQERVREHQDEVWKLIEAGAVIYVCGDASGMAPAQRHAFAAIYSAKTGASAEVAESWIQQMTTDRRYLVDVWSAT
jgi:cytochrome P450/NADPH-cytochrome P450 reductase